MLSCVLAIKTILFLGSLNNLKCSERIRHVPPGDQTISAGGALGQRSTVPKQLVCLVSLSELKINFISERTGTGGGRRVGSGGRQLEEYPRLALSFPPPVCHSYARLVVELLSSRPSPHIKYSLQLVQTRRQGTEIITLGLHVNLLNLK